MQLQARLEHGLLKLADHWVARLRQPPPPARRLAAAQIVAHRGVYDNRRVFENTLAAFERFGEAGGWGLELDVRWTQDGVPVVSHDPDGRRLFGLEGRIAAMDLKTMQRRLPLVPTLKDVVAKFGGQLHLMVEIKTLPPGAVGRPRAVLQRHFENLVPAKDYHILSLDPNLLHHLGFSPPRACLPIARMNLHKVKRAMRTGAWGGMAGHYALVRRPDIKALHHGGYHVGTGYINSPSCLYREVARGIDWLFSDRALALQQLVTRAAMGSSEMLRTG
jgi:glycerophosphoryl diester phosphodiesterase